MSVHLTGDGAPIALNRLAREQMKHKLLSDINTDMMVCQIEGTDHLEYVRELHELIAHFDPCEVKHGNDDGHQDYRL